MQTSLPLPLVIAGLVISFGLTEQLLLNIEFRRQAHSLTLAGIPLAIGLLVAPLPFVVLARAAGAGIALLLQRISGEKILYNTAAWAFEVAVDGACLGALFGSMSHLTPATAVAVTAVIVMCDQAMGVLVLYVIHLHGAALTRTAIRDVLVPAALVSIVSTVAALGVLLLAGDGTLGIIIVVVFAGVATLMYRGYLVTTRRHQRLELLNEFVTVSVGAESFAAVTEQLLRRVRTLLRAQSAEILVVTDTGVVNGRGAQQVGRLTDNETAGFSVRDDVAVLDWPTVRAIDQGEPLIAARITKDRAIRGWLSETGHREALVVALPSSSAFLGTLTVSNRLGETATFTPDDLTLLQTLTGHLAVAAGSAQLVERLAHDATHDALTGLANRAHLARQIDACQPADGTHACVMLLDLDRFKEVNDGLGHAAGDQLLRVVAKRLEAELPPSATVARVGGDEFAALVPDHRGGEAAARELGERLAAVLAMPVLVDEALLTPDASLGIALSTNAAPVQDLLRRADTAMYTAKNADTTVAVFHPDMDRGRVENLALLAELRVALREQPEQIAVYFQPKVDLATRAVISAEALVRWNHPQLGVIGPDRFIPLAETTGLIDQITPLVLRGALAECARWRRDGHDLTVAINLAARNVCNPRLPDIVAQALAHTGVPPCSVVLEITESSVMTDPHQAHEVLDALADMGVALSLDDFGTGYSSLSYLHRMPVKEVKIDRSFVLGLTSNNPLPSRALISSIATLSRTLGLRLVAEGVETDDLMDQLTELGCDVAQGYVISRPLPPPAFHAWLSERHSSWRAPEHEPLRLLISR